MFVILRSCSARVYSFLTFSISTLPTGTLTGTHYSTHVTKVHPCIRSVALALQDSSEFDYIGHGSGVMSVGDWEVLLRSKCSPYPIYGCPSHGLPYLRIHVIAFGEVWAHSRCAPPLVSLPVLHPTQLPDSAIVVCNEEGNHTSENTRLHGYRSLCRTAFNLPPLETKTCKKLQICCASSVANRHQGVRDVAWHARRSCPS